MRKRRRSNSDNYPKAFEDDEGEIYIITQDHCDFIRIVPLVKSSCIYSAEYTILDELLNNHKDFKEININISIQ